MIRADHKLRTLDAIQTAAAVAMGVDFFLTNDETLAILPNPIVLVLKNQDE